MRAAPPLEEAHEARAGSLAPLDSQGRYIFVKQEVLIPRGETRFSGRGAGAALLHNQNFYYLKIRGEKTMKLIYRLSVFVLLTGFSLQTSNAQVRMERRIEGGDGAFHLKEVQTIFTSKDDTIKVMMVLPERLRPKGYGDIVLKENDEILMVNAKRVKTVQKFEELYNALEIGETLKMGIRRKGELMIESFKKIDPEDMPEGANIMILNDMPGEEEGHEGGMMRTFTMDGGDSEEMRPWFGTGLVLGMEDDKIKIIRIMEGMTGALGKADIKEGDEIKSLNGQKVETLDKFFEMYEKLDTGSKVEIEYARAGKKMQAAFEKPNVQGRMRMRREN